MQVAWIQRSQRHGTWQCLSSLRCASKHMNHWITGRFSHFEWLKTLSPKTAPPWIVSQNSAQETEPLPSSVAISDDTSPQRFAPGSYVARQHRSAEKWHPALQVIDLASGPLVDIGDVNTWNWNLSIFCFLGVEPFKRWPFPIKTRVI